MIRLNDIQSAFEGLVGWEQGFGPNTIDASLTTSESGLTFQAAHPLVTIENIRQTMPTDWYADAWSNDTIYHEGQAVSIDSLVFVCVVKDSTQGVSPITEGNDEWMDVLSWYIRKLTRDSINTVIQSFLTQKQLNRETKSLVDRRAFFDGAARLQATINPTGKLVGFEIIPVRALGVTTKIERIGLQMAGVTEPFDLTLYLFHSSQAEPVREIKVRFTNTNGTFQWFDKEVYLPYIGEDTDTGGAWFLCYDQNALPAGVRALNVSRDWSKSPCETCYGYALDAWKEITDWMQVSPFCIKAPQDFDQFPTCPDIGRVSYTNTINYGLNCVVTVGCDLTDFIIRQKAIFASVLQKQVAASVLRMMAMNPETRVNRNQANITREGILYEVDGNPQGRASGLAYEVAQSYKALSLDTEGLDRVCLKCNNRGVKYRTV